MVLGAVMGVYTSVPDGRSDDLQAFGVEARSQELAVAEEKQMSARCVQRLPGAFNDRVALAGGGHQRVDAPLVARRGPKQNGGAVPDDRRVCMQRVARIAAERR
jgi:hypothetical protein